MEKQLLTKIYLFLSTFGLSNISFADGKWECLPKGVIGLARGDISWKHFIVPTTILTILVLLSIICFLRSIRLFKSDRNKPTLIRKFLSVFLFLCSILFIAFPLFNLYEILSSAYRYYLCYPNIPVFHGQF